MLKERLKRIGVWFLTASLLMGSVQFPARAEETPERVNVALDAEASASEVESGTDFTADKAIDGDRDTRGSRWGTNKDSSPVWMQLAWDDVQVIDGCTVVWERRTARNYKIEVSNTGAEGSWETVYEKAEMPENRIEEITFDAVEAKYLRLYVSEISATCPEDAMEWASISVYELEVYAAAGTADTGENLAKSSTASASEFEAGTSFTADKAIDGDKENTRWASNEGSKPVWLQLAWEEPQEMKTFYIKWERRTAQNYKLEVSDTGEDGSWRAVYESDQIPAAKEDEIVLDKAVTAKYLRLYVSEINAACPDDTTQWASVSVYEFEVYKKKRPDNTSQLQKIAAGIKAAEIAEDGSHIVMPEVPAGITVSFCADYEQVIGEDGTIYAPLTGRNIKGIFEVTDGKDSAKTGEFTVAVPGVHEDAGKNAKPAVIPELQEWYGGEGTFFAKASAKIVVGNAALKATADAFAADYKAVTGFDISVTEGTKENAGEGDYYFGLAQSGQGLGKEGYTMEVGDAVAVEAEQATGVYWATRSILQILKQYGGSIPKGIAKDYPKYEVRAFMIDVGRKPFALDTLYQFAKNMAWYKMNSFQIHLSDNLIFHEDYPTLEEAAEQSYAGFRLESGVVNEDTKKSATSEDMYYTKDEFRSFIQDSRAIGVDIVPEFDMPAHALPFTRAFPQFMTKKAGGGHAYLIEELNLEQEGVTEWAQSIWNDYFEGDNPVFDEDMTVHIGTDEYHGTEGEAGRELFRKFSDDMIKFVQGKGRDVRMWGSLSNKYGKTPVASEGVQLNIWNTGYADPTAMYKLGYELINTLEGWNYIVPAAGYYNDYINASNIYSNWQPNVIGDLNASAGDDQILGGCYAIWHDSIDTRANGISQYDSFDRFFKPLPAYGAKLWGDAKDRTYNEFAEVAAKTGTAPNTNVYAEVDFATKTIADYTFDQSLNKDSSANGFDLTGSENTELVTSTGGKALALKGGASYAETPLDLIGENAVVTMKVKMDADASGEQILCESKDAFGAYGTYAIKASQKITGKVGYSREGYNFSFDYELPKNEWVELSFHSGQNSVALYVNGELVDNNPAIYFENHPENELTEILKAKKITKVATMLAPLGRIGSNTNSFKGQIENLTVTASQELSADYGALDRSKWKAEACSQATSEGPAEDAIDGDDNTYWHSDWSNDTTVSEENPHWFKVTLDQPAMINKLTYLPRQSSRNGRIFTYSIEVEKADGTTELVADHAIWPDNASRKTATFSPIEAKSVKILIYEAAGDNNGIHATIGELNLYEPVSFSKEDLQKEIAKYSDYRAESFTEMSWKAFVKARTAAEQTVQGGKDATEFLYAYEQLKAAAGNLVSKLEDNLKVLREAISTAEGLLENVVIYTEESVKALQDAVEEAKTVLNNPNATADQIRSAVEKLENTKLVENPAIIAKREELTGEVAAAEEMITQTDVYTAATISALRRAVNAANRVLNNENASLEELTQAFDDLKAVDIVTIAQEELNTRKEELVSLIAASREALAASGYTEASVRALQGAIAEAETIVNQENATLEAVMEVFQKLQDAKAALTPVDPAIAQKKTQLTAAITAAEALLANTAGYTAESVAALQQAVANAKTVLNNANATAAELDAAIAAVTGAKLEGVSNIEPAPQIPAVGTVKTEKGLQFKVTKSDLTNGTVTVVKPQSKKVKKVTIPATVKINGVTFKVTAIAANAFQNAKSLETVTIGKNVTKIGKNAFNKCSKLRKVTFKGIKSPKIGTKAFKGTNAKCTVKAPKKMGKKEFNKLKTALKKAKISSKSSIKK